MIFNYYAKDISFVIRNESYICIRILQKSLLMLSSDSPSRNKPGKDIKIKEPRRTCLDARLRSVE